MKKYNSVVELQQSRDVNLVLRKTAMIVREVPFLQEGRFRKSTVRILTFLFFLFFGGGS